MPYRDSVSLRFFLLVVLLFPSFLFSCCCCFLSSLFFLPRAELMAQGKAAAAEKVHVPYRDSVLTQLLRDALGQCEMKRRAKKVKEEESSVRKEEHPKDEKAPVPYLTQ